MRAIRIKLSRDQPYQDTAAKMDEVKHEESHEKEFAKIPIMSGILK